MVGSSKILTVSYGTFSCTLEGFDDSFSTMKAIAEYFRDLAADDRYFGAEPPTPDAEMLARIAEREIARRVEARTEGTGIVLKAGQALSAPVTDRETIAEAVEDKPGTGPEPAEPADIAAGHDDDALAEVASSGARVIDEAADDSPAEAAAPAKEAEVPAEGRQAPAVAPGEEVDEDETDPLDYEVAASKLAESLAARPTPHRVAPVRVMPPASAMSDDDEEEEEPPVAAVTDMPPALTAPPAHPDADSVAAKLERIRAVVGKAREQGFDTEPAETDAAPSGGTVSAFDEDEPATIDPDLSVSDPQEVAAPAAATSAAPRPVRTRVIKMSLADFQRSVAQGDLDPVVAGDDAAAHEMRDTGHPSDEARIDAFEAGFGDRDDDEGDFDDFEDFDDQAFEGQVSDDRSDDDASDDGIEDISEDDLADLAALDGDPADWSAQDEDLDGDDLKGEESDPVESADDESWLTDEEEAELLAELAELQRDEETERGAELPAGGPARPAAAAHRTDDRSVEVTAAETTDETAGDLARNVAEVAQDTPRAAGSSETIEDPDDDGDDAPLNLFGGSEDDEDDDFEPENAIYSGDDEDDEDDVDTDPRMLRRQRAFEKSPDDDGEVLSRLIEQTDDQLNHPETNRRRESITQLKAAVAATEAARQMGEPERKGAGSDDEFRNDLRQAVRPRRPTRPADRPVTRTERPQTAPLKLVASQRVDLDREPARPAAPVRPRRVRLDEAGPAEAARDAGSFEAFARDMGAQGLAELLEAAAAYTAYVEGSEDFSRPQLMSKVRGLTDRDFSREEGLRSFGRLLREGRIMKVRNGRFQVSDETRFHPERRAG